MSTNTSDADLIADAALLPLEPLPIPDGAAGGGTNNSKADPKGSDKGSSANACGDEAMDTGDERDNNNADHDGEAVEDGDTKGEEKGNNADMEMVDDAAGISASGQTIGATSGRTPSGEQPQLFTAKIRQLIEHIRAGTLPSRDQGPRGIQNALPARYTVPPEHSLGGKSFIVGVPAGGHAHRESAFLCEGYGGLEAMMMFEGLSEVDLQHLCELIGDSVEVRELILRPYHDQDTPSLTSLEALLNSLVARREFASLLMYFPVHQLAQKVFYTVSTIRHLLARDRQRQAVFDDIDGESSAAELLQLRTKYDQLKRDVVFVDEYYRQQLNRAMLDDNFRRLAKENLEETSALQGRVDELETQLAYANTQIAHLQRSAQETRFDTARLMDFLNSGGTEVRGNWPRLRKLFRRFQNGAIPPGDWRTWITSDDDEGGADGDAQEEKTEDNPPPASVPVATPPRCTQQSSPGSSKSGSGRGSSSKKVKVVQRRPSAHPKSQVGPRPPRFPLKLLVQEACALLPEFIAWQDLRPDVQWPMRSGVDYHEAVNTLGMDQVGHGHFHRDSLLKMLATMMYHRKLDETPWAQYVPVSYYRMAEVILDDWLDKEYVPPAWPPLRNLAEDLVEDAEASSSSSEDDKATDPDYNIGDAVDEDDDNDEDDEKHDDEGDDGDSSSSSTGDEPARKPKRKASSQRVRSSSDSSSESASRVKPKKLTYSPSPKRPRQSRSGSTSGKKTGSLRSRARTELEKRKSPLARKKYNELTPAELAMIEQPTKGVLSWRRRGILSQFTPKKNGHENQTPGFPEYCLKVAWNVSTRAGLQLKLSLLLPQALGTSGRVRDHAEVFWYMLHRFSIKIKAAKGEPVDPLKYLLANTLYDRRREQHENIGRGMGDRVKRIIKKGVPASVFDEPGIWVYPAKICYIYLTDSSTLNAQGDPYSFAEQNEKAERVEPSRTQWPYYCTDCDRMAHVSHDLRLRELSPEERAANPISHTVE
ncbi:hypothetical protein PHYSODRAFT_322894 [Phytophthora sojae]|uniref:Uncharacterized protein n=1 Tax=Phytophthora sojae (strain P6497) TaxID=1094619 RepID=G4YHQ3_PHYSP|nr:hypothetical protein PHYSODRAFT_322894 [Phytophthora sojae]EGZ29371.1 hypothetical protein PHYSODRAFT_322894 [Phytophthora sojae]|eukprot:XP_009516646.1 hypothetical protein PHYSODRAFT_322894 [Phytophthora sojae]